ncbi:MAG: alpha/beta hydrolase-fold protein [Saprospiraceae bacterium]|jgi:predicted alpha/beta superfamily hydrolase|nr:alpha/beta hydrolase-fold protein [Saprospiraceae bacterium]
MTIGATQKISAENITNKHLNHQMQIIELALTQKSSLISFSGMSVTGYGIAGTSELLLSQIDSRLILFCEYLNQSIRDQYDEIKIYLIKYIFTALLLFGVSYSSMAQTILTGVVVDSDHQSVLAFVNIGIKKKNIGTSSLDDGTFSIMIPKQNENDTLTLSMVGYSELNIPIQSILTTHQKTFQLMEKSSSLNTVVVTASKLVERKFGIKKTGTITHFTDGSTHQNDIFEIAQLIKLDTILSKITSVNLHINQSRKDSGTFRINFYKYAGNRPSERIIETSIIQTKQIQEGWLKFDLTPYKVYLKGSFVVAIEFIPNKRTNHPIYYEMKLGGSAKSFVRTSSQGEWSVPPHHYRLFVTALVSDKKNKFREDELEDKESIPVTTLFSKNVNDSFSIFVSLPKDYTKKKNQNFPVIYLLDANVYFDIIADAMNEIHSKAILVGIGYKDFVMMDSLRNRDYTFPKASPQDSFPISGGAFNFLFFVKNEIIRYIDKAYRTETNNRTLMGHSLGAYFTLFVLMQEILNTDHTFKNYVAASPSLHYGNKFLMDQFKQSVSYDNSIQQNLWLTCGAKEDIEDSTGTEGIDNFNSFVHILESSKYKGINLKVEVYPAFGHMETAVPTFVKSLKGIE